ncbi:hypothetical protein [Paraburkholderia aromaticivorans]|uniref:hypothetical protein n=1 Tax=Paraburkholderia aromaticivorans TaxID=2026199 RepID=UPI0014561FCC|nr:hypothetical protein [Paraburkholderia aromaticivorans]
MTAPYERLLAALAAYPAGEPGVKAPTDWPKDKAHVHALPFSFSEEPRKNAGKPIKSRAALRGLAA